jgi:hypothetical protein
LRSRKSVDADFRVVEALAINDGRIVARGTSAEMARYAGPDAFAAHREAAAGLRSRRSAATSSGLEAQF